MKHIKIRWEDISYEAKIKLGIQNYVYLNGTVIAEGDIEDGTNDD